MILRKVCREDGYMASISTHTCASSLPDELVDDLFAEMYAQVEEHGLQLGRVDGPVLVLVEHDERCLQLCNGLKKNRQKNHE
jgi:hypothetical protein